VSGCNTGGLRQFGDTKRAVRFGFERYDYSAVANNTADSDAAELSVVRRTIAEDELSNPTH
jgi:hypothetical protein